MKKILAILILAAGLSAQTPRINGIPNQSVSVSTSCTLSGTTGSLTIDPTSCNSTAGVFNTIQVGAMTGNVTLAFTASHASLGAEYSIVLVQDGTGGRTVSFPGNVVGGCVDTTASARTLLTGTMDASGTNLLVASCTPIDQVATSINGPTRSAEGTPASGNVNMWFDSTANMPQAKDSSGNLNSFIRTAGAATSNQFGTYVDALGVLHTAQPAFSNISGTCTVGQGCTNLTSGTSGGVLGATASGTYAWSIAGAANAPMLWGGAGATPVAGTRGGNTTTFSTETGSFATNDCLKKDGSGNVVSAGAACGSGGASPGSSIYSAVAATSPNTGTSATSMLGGARTIPTGNFITSTPITIVQGGVYTLPATYLGTVAVAAFLDGSQIATTGAFSVPTTAVTNGTWTVECQFTTYTTGASGTYAFGCPVLLMPTSNSVVTLNGDSLSIAGAGTTFDTTTSHTFDLKWTWSTATGSPSVTGQWYSATVGGAPVTSVGGATGAVLPAGSNGQVAVQIAGVPGYMDFPQVFEFPAANYNGNSTNAGAGWSLGTTGTVVARAGTNNLGAYALITDTSTTFAQLPPFRIPKDWSTGVNPYVSFIVASSDTTNGHTIIPAIQVSCSKVDGTTTDDVTFNAAHSSSTVTLNTTANQTWESTMQMNNTDTTGCVAGGTMIVSIQRATDTATNAHFYTVAITVSRRIVVQAN